MGVVHALVLRDQLKTKRQLLIFKTKILNISNMKQQLVYIKKFSIILIESIVVSNKFTGEHPCRNAISIKLQSNFIEIALWHGCFPVNLLHIFKTLFLKNTSGWLLLKVDLLPKNMAEKRLVFNLIKKIGNNLRDKPSSRLTYLVFK